MRELRKGTPVAGLVIVAVLVDVLLWSKGADWGARWNELGFAARDYMIVIAPLCLMLGVWSGGRLRRSDGTELLASTRRSAFARTSSEVVALALALYVGLLLGVASVAWSIVLIGGYGTWAVVGYLAGAFPTTLAYAAVGYLLGRVFTWRVAAPVAGVLTYAGLGFVVWNDDRWAILTGGGWLGGTDGSPFDSQALVWSILYLLVAATLALALGSAERRTASSRAWAATALAGSLALAGLVPASAAAASRDLPDRARTEADVVCTTDDGPRVCVPIEDRHLLAPMTVRAREVLARFRGIAGAPTWAGPRNLDSPPGPDTRLDVDAGGTTPWGGPDRRWGGSMYVDVFSFVSPYRYNCPADDFGNLAGDADGEIFMTRSDLVAVFVSTDDTFAEEGLEAGSPQARFQDSSDAQRRDFAGRVIAAARTCDLRAVTAADNALARP